jgi:hypothetical protein
MHRLTQLALGGIVALLFVAGCLPGPRAGQSPGVRPGPGVFFVATNGDDHWSGGMPLPNERRSNGPFATLARAVDAARQFKTGSAGGAGPSAAIFVRGGTHFLSEPLVLKPADSGLRIQAYPAEHPLVSGGRRILKWDMATIDGKSFWVSDIPEVASGQWFFRELWVNGNRRGRARYPAMGTLQIDSLTDKSSQWTNSKSCFRFRQDDLKDWPSLTNAEVVVLSLWVESRLSIASVNEAQSVVCFGQSPVFGMHPGDLYYVENVFEVLQTPGDWCLDRAKGKLFYLPLPWERPETTEVIAPVLSQLVRLEGQGQAAQFVDGVQIVGLGFAHAEWGLPPGSSGFPQAAVGVPGAVWGRGVRRCLFEHCTFSHLGGYGLELARGSESNRISRCEFNDLGAGGIKIGEMELPGTKAEESRGNEISDCHLHHGGRVFPSAVGIWIGQSPDNRIRHNLIHDFFYTGISLGWTWGYGAALATNTLVEWNHIHHIGIQSDGEGALLSDLGGIYTLGRQTGTRIVNNLWHDIAATGYGGWGIYFDEGTSGILAASNLVYRTTHGGFHQHYGATNLLVNNIFAVSRDQQLQRTRQEPHVSFTFTNNIVFFDHGQLLGSNWKDDRFISEGNLYWDTRLAGQSNGLRFAGASLEEWRRRGHDRLSIVADPLFFDDQRDDFRLRPDSPARALGFRPIDLRAVGPR